jgi:cytidylate kinase
LCGVLEGRDIGTKVFPDTPHKFFLTARPDVRARRRYEEMLAKGESVSFDDVLADSVARDAQDSSREDSPLTCDETYQVIDTSDLTIDEVVGQIVAAARGRS